MLLLADNDDGGGGGVQHPFSAELEQAIDVLKEAIAKENWEVKGKFPPGIKPLLAQVALKAVILGEYDENFFNLMPRLFPYNKFTMTVSSDLRRVGAHMYAYICWVR